MPPVSRKADPIIEAPADVDLGVLKDVIDEKIDTNHAREAYGVVIDSETGRIDAEKTRTLRAERR